MIDNSVARHRETPECGYAPGFIKGERILVNDMKKMVHEVHDYSKRYKELLIKYLERGYVVNLEPVQALVYDRSETYAEAESKPTANDMADTETLLKDFGVTGELPDFKSAFEMNRWRRKTIKSVL